MRMFLLLVKPKVQFSMLGREWASVSVQRTVHWLPLRWFPRTLLASTHVNHNIYITEVKTGKCVHSLIGHRRTPWARATFSSHHLRPHRFWLPRWGGSDLDLHECFPFFGTLDAETYLPLRSWLWRRDWPCSRTVPEYLVVTAYLMRGVFHFKVNTLFNCLPIVTRYRTCWDVVRGGFLFLDQGLYCYSDHDRQSSVLLVLETG